MGRGGLKAGSLRAVVATSSLDLGVDFLPVERVLQIGSAKGVARLLQRAGRSGHQPGRASRVTLVPTNTLELVEAVAARRAALAGRVESRAAPDAPLDVLVQHLVSMALGGGFRSRRAVSRGARRAQLSPATRDAFQWALDFVEHGGSSLQRLSRVPPRGAARRPLARAQPRHRAAPPAAGGHHRRRCVDAGEVAVAAARSARWKSRSLRG